MKINTYEFFLIFIIEMIIIADKGSAKVKQIMHLYILIMMCCYYYY